MIELLIRTFNHISDNSAYSTPQVANEDNENSQSNNEVLEDDDECNFIDVMLMILTSTSFILETEFILFYVWAFTPGQ